MTTDDTKDLSQVKTKQPMTEFLDYSPDDNETAEKKSQKLRKKVQEKIDL
jgi:hypothetical protein